MMYLVSYDLKGGEPSEYQKLYEEFDTFDDCKKCLESSWLVVTSKTCVEVRDQLRAMLKENDLIVVVPYGPTRASWLPNEVIAWIKERLPE